MSNNDNNDDNLQLFDWLLTNSVVDMTTTALPGNNVSGNEAFGNVNSFEALFESPLPQVMPLSPLQAIPTQQQPLDALTMDTSAQSIFNTPPAITTPIVNNTPNTQSASSASPDGRYSKNSSGSMSDEHLQQNEQSNGEKSPDKQQQDQTDHPSESELKKMTSKERRQLRNKISARKFRSRKKEYVTTLEHDLQHQKHENERLNLEVSFIRENADKLQKERDDLKLQLALCREKNRELMRRLDKGGSSSSSRPPKNNNDDNQTPSSSSSSPSSKGFNASNTLDTNTHSSSANNKMNSLDKSLPMETAVANNTVTNIDLPSPPSSPQHHAHYSSKPHQQGDYNSSNEFVNED
ncbi:hypothetical protein K492DRAFT_189102 [Lichtheimia hyalospora FSU 10163]|nr:hypothetical protein K492DRAFT_189102 [Lichtheimia hyalospora FSU 10163]